MLPITDCLNIFIKCFNLPYLRIVCLALTVLTKLYVYNEANIKHSRGNCVTHFLKYFTLFTRS